MATLGSCQGIYGSFEELFVIPRRHRSLDLQVLVYNAPFAVLNMPDLEAGRTRKQYCSKQKAKPFEQKVISSSNR